MPKLRREQTDAAFTGRLMTVVESCDSVLWLANEIERSHGAIRKWLRGESQPNATDLRLICEATGFSIQWLVLGTGPARTVDIPTAAAKIDERRFFSVLQTLVDQADELSLELEPIELGHLLIEFYERTEPFGEIRLDDFRRKLQIMVASRPGG